MTADQTINIPLKPGARVSILTDVDMDEGGFTASTEYEATVEKYVPQTNELRMSDGTGFDEFREMIMDADSFQVIHEDD